MRKLVVFMLVVFLVGCVQTENTAVNESVDEKEVKAKQSISQEDLIDGLFIGEAFSDGNVYIEKYSVDRNTYNEKTEIENSKMKIRFSSLDDDRSFECEFMSEFESYVPDQQIESKYYYQGFSTPNQYGLKYSHNELETGFIGIAHMDYVFENFNDEIRGDKRPSSETEIEEAQKLLDDDKNINDEDRILDALDEEWTLLGAEYICSFEIQDTDYKLLVSKYQTHTIEYVADVYVIDLVLNNDVIATFSKHNWDGPL